MKSYFSTMLCLYFSEHIQCYVNRDISSLYQTTILNITTKTSVRESEGNLIYKKLNRKKVTDSLQLEETTMNI